MADFDLDAMLENALDEVMDSDLQSMLDSAADEVFEAKAAEEGVPPLAAEAEEILAKCLLVFPASKRGAWLNRMRRDVLKQQQGDYEARPLSRAYKERRAGAAEVEPRLRNLLSELLRKSANKAFEGRETIPAPLVLDNAVLKALAAQHREQLLRDCRPLVDRHPGFDPAKFPETTAGLFRP